MVDFENAINAETLSNLSLSELKAVNKVLKKVPKPQNLHGCDYIKSLISRYYNLGGQVITVEPGCLGYGTLIMFGEKLKTTIVKEIYLNEWSSGHTVRMYNKCPRKYADMITAYYNNDDKEEYNEHDRF